MGILFPVQKKTKKGQWFFFIVCLTLTIVYCLYKLSTNKSFLTYSKQNYYTPLNGDSSGFTGKANSILAAALLDTNENVVYDVRNLNAFYRRLRFYYPIDSANYLASIFDIRLDEIVPLNRDESIFIKNSYLKETLERQVKNRSRQFFKIRFDPKNNYRISAILIDPALYKTKISSDEWKGEICFVDPFTNIDPTATFIVFQNNFFPVFTSSLDAFNDPRDDYKIRRNSETFFKYLPEEGQQELRFDLLNDLQDCYNSLAVQNRPFRLILGRERRANGEPQFLRMQNFRDHCELQFNDIDSGFIIDQKGAITAILNNHTIAFQFQDLPVKIKYKDQGRFYDFSIRKNSPLTTASKPKNIFIADERIHLPDEYSDLFTRQFVTTLENNLTRSDTSLKYYLSVNPLLSKYLENEIKNYVTTVRQQLRNQAGYNDVFEISMALVDNKTGEIIAAPFYSTEFEFSPTDELTEINWIEGIQEEKIDDEDQERVQQTKNYYCKRWISALVAIGDANKKLLEQKSQEYAEKYPHEISNPDFDSYSTTRFGFDRPISDEDFEKMSIDEQIEFIKKFKPEHPGDTSDEGLAQQLTESVIEKPENYVFSLDKFIVLPPMYTQALLEGFTKSVHKDALTDFGLVLDFIDKAIVSEAFQIKSDTRIDYRKVFVRESGEFAKSIVAKPETFSFSEEDIRRVLTLLINFLNVDEYKDNDETINHDYPTHILNSTQGRLHLALLETTWLWAKLFGGKEEIKWPKETKEYFVSRLYRKSAADKDYSMILGQQLHTFLWLDKAWVEENILNIFPATNPTHEEYALSSSLSLYMRPDKRVYDLFKKYGLFDKAISLYNYECGSLEALCNYAVYEWRFWGGENIANESILQKILSNNNEKQIYQLLHSIWKNKILTKEQVLELWPKIISISANDKDKFRPIYRALTWQTDIFNELSDEIAGLLHQSIDNFETNDREAYQLSRSIFKLADTNIKNAGDLLLHIFEKTDINPYSTSELQEFVEKLYRSGNKELADDICHYIGDNKGSLILRELFEKNSSFQKE